MGRELDGSVTGAAEGVDIQEGYHIGRVNFHLQAMSLGNSSADQFGREAHESKRILENMVTVAKGGKKSE
jgi:hypothetical protein